MPSKEFYSSCKNWKSRITVQVSTFFLSTKMAYFHIPKKVSGITKLGAGDKSIYI